MREFIMKDAYSFDVSEDEFKKDETELQKVTDQYMGKLEELSKKKEAEIRA